MTDHRKELNEIDRELVALYQRRLDVVRNLAQDKRAGGKPICDPEREQAIFEAAAKRSLPENAGCVRALFEHILGASKAEQRRLYNVYLIGMSGSGKSHWAKLLAGALNRPWADTDAMVQKSRGMSIPEIFRAGGEAAFREAERQALLECARRGRLVAATGGGILNGNNLEVMKGSGRIVFLNRGLDKLLAQDISGRPMLGCREDIPRLLEERMPGYIGAADITVDPDAEDALQTLCDFLAE